MRVQLHVIAGPDQGLIIPLTEGKPLQLGRGAQPDVSLNDLYVSRLHCRVQLRGGQLHVTDLGSAGGTYINTEPVTERVLRMGEELQLGETHLRLRLAGQAALDQATIAPPMAEAIEMPDQPPPAAVPQAAAPPSPKQTFVVDPAARAPTTSAAPASPKQTFVVDPSAPMPAPAPSPTPANTFVVEPPPPKRRSGLSPQPSPADAPRKPTSIKLLPSERLTELTGEMLAHYKIGPLLGRGKSGLVFHARDTVKDRDVALKVLWPEFTKDDAEIQRFVRSMKTAMTLQHPNLITVHGAGKKGPYSYIAMEYVEGESLTELIRRLGVAGRVDWRHAFRVTMHLARALSFAHEQQIIHRNITPQNVMIRAADKNTMLGDLFLAKAMEGGLAAHLTRPGEVLGDVRYMAPERLEGMSHIDQRSDIYSLGALVYTLLAGQPPFDGATLLDVIVKVRSQEAEDAKKFQMAIPDAFNGTVRQMLAKRPEARYQEATELLKDLERMAKFIRVDV